LSWQYFRLFQQNRPKADPALQLSDANADKQNHHPEHEDSEAAGSHSVSDRNAA
jgi:hypothetical protein